MTTIGRRAALLFSLPVPVFATSNAVPFYVIDPCDAAERSLNEHTSSWWHTRLALTDLVYAVQERTLAVAATEEEAYPAANELWVELSRALQLATHNAEQWSNLYRELYKRGSAWCARCAFVPAWFTLHPVQNFLVYNFGNINTGVPRTRMLHQSPSLAFEGVMLGYLQAALQKQVATMLGLVLRHGPPTSIVPVSDTDVIDMLCRARGTLKDVWEKKLYLHSALFDGTETFLLSPHIYQQFLFRIVYSQQCSFTAASVYVQSVKNEESDIAGLLCSAALFALSARILGVAQRAGYGDASELGALVCTRQSSALITLALALHAADKQMITGDAIRYTKQSHSSDSVPDYRAFAVEAYYCARAAVALTPDLDVSRRIFDRIATRLHSMYGAVLPTITPPAPSSIVDEVRRTGGSRHVAWQRVFGRISIETQLACPNTMLHITHTPPTSEVISMGKEKRNFIIKAQWELN